MILDAIIGLLASIFGFLAGGVAAVTVPLVNIIAAAIEAMVGIVFSGFTLGRIEHKGDKPPPRSQIVGGALTLLLVVGIVGWLVIAPKVRDREVTLVAEDGHSLPFAALVIHTKGGDQHRRTDNAGNIVIPRSGTTGITVKDPRYVERTWESSEIGPELVVKRTVLGSGLDSLAERLLKPVDE